MNGIPFYLLDYEELPSFHFGVILESDEWENTYDRINSQWMFDTVVKKTIPEIILRYLQQS